MAEQLEIYYPGKINLKVDFPTTWNDLSEKQLRYVANILLHQTNENLFESMPSILHYILKSWVPSRLLATMDAEQVSMDLLPLLNFILTDNDRTNTPQPIRRRMRLFYTCPFEDITCGEFEDAEFAANKFAEDPKPEHLALLAAILFRPKKKPYIRYSPSRDAYIFYNPEGRKKMFMKLKPEHLYSIFIWYAGCRSQLKLYFPDLYDGGKKDGEPDPMIFTNTIHAGAGPKNGSRNQIRRMKLYEFLYDCNQEAKKAKEIEAMYNS